MAKSGNFFSLFLHFGRSNNSEDMKNKTKFHQKSTVKTQNQSVLAPVKGCVTKELYSAQKILQDVELLMSSK